MTIVFQGHVQKLEGTPTGVAVTIRPAISACPHDIVLLVPRIDAANWLPGDLVSFTVYAMPGPSKGGV